MNIISYFKHKYEDKKVEKRTLLKKRAFIRFLKEYDASYQFKRNFIKLHKNFYLNNTEIHLENHNYTFDSFIRGMVNQRPSELIRFAFSWGDTNNSSLWFSLNYLLSKIELKQSEITTTSW